MRGGRLKIVNESHHPTEEVEPLVRFGLQEIDLRGESLLAIVKDTTSRRVYSGVAYRVDASKYEIIMRIGPPVAFPIRPFRRNGHLFDYQSWQEALVGVTAHEGMHIQHRYDGAYEERALVRRKDYAGGWARRRVGDQRVEPKCEAHELFVLRKFREANV